MKKILTVFGTRPEATKMCPLVLEMKRRQTFRTVVCVTSQHKEMLASALDFFSVAPDYDLDIMTAGQTLFDIGEKTTRGLREIIGKETPDVVAVHGDTTTAFASALCAFYMGVPVAHVEAGLRTFDVSSPYPEEFNRAAIDKIAKYCFAPTERAAQNLAREGKRNDEIFVVGNTAIDALKYTKRGEVRREILDAARGKRIITVTAHRRENIGDHMKNMFSAIADIARTYPDTLTVYPVHKNPAVTALAKEYLDGIENIILCEPMKTPEFHSLLSGSYLTLTDSGGIQEEAPSLGCPVIVMRDTTERPEAVEAGTAILAGTGRKEIFDAAARLLDDASLHDKMKSAKNPFGDGFASRRICDILEKI
ncbi:MAG: UDP-N-acetylglucosamine 2-epimerase (non-hydrolyzing) [Clostridia bacterium]|nr:UDP-N-acetylglucosamine 2-epimerase (non-hydrolyzing) [Clostridia bacterium]